MFPFIFLLLSSLAAASQLNFPICPHNLHGQYYIVFGSPTPSTAAVQQEISGVSFSLYSTACETYGLRPANIKASIVHDLVNLLHQCWPIVNKSAKLAEPEHALWINSYEWLPKLLQCNSLYDDGSFWSDSTLCTNYTMPALCEVPKDPIPSANFTESETTTEESGLSFLTTTLLSTETLTEYYVARITAEGANTLTTITSFSTITRAFTSSYLPTSSSSESDCCSLNHNRLGCRDCEAEKIQQNVDFWKSAELVKSPNEVQQSYVRCLTSSGGYYLVRQGILIGLKDMEETNINGVQACTNFGYSLANVTAPLLTSLKSLFDSCMLVTQSFVFNNWYAYKPLCGFSTYNSLLIANGLGLNDSENTKCGAAGWALCKSGAPLISTSTVPTGPFTTGTTTLTRTNTVTTTGTTTSTRTITQIPVVTVTGTITSTLTSSTRTTVTTTSVTVSSTCSF